MAGKNKRKLEDLSVDEFMLSGFDSDEEDDCEDEEPSPKKGKSKTPALQKTSVKKHGKASEHKDQLSALKTKDPEFYKFLEQNDQELLNFDDTDSDEEEEDEEEQMYHKLPSQLEDDDDDDEEEEEDEEDSKKKDVKKQKSSKEGTKVTEAMIENWKTALKKEPTPTLIRDITQAFKAAVATTKGDSDELCRYVISDSAVFNSLVLFCIRDMHAALQKMLKLKTPDKDTKKLVLPFSSTRWQKNQIDIKMYLAGVVQLLSSLTQATVIAAVLRHANQMVPYYLCLPKQCRQFLKSLIKHWSTGEETVRVLAFLALNKICRHKPDAHLSAVLKQMYIAYVQNCKFTSPNTLPMINFMQRTLAEMYSLDTQVSYQHTFLYIRQLAIHLRNAMNLKKKETYQSVYNWQYVHCLYLWCRVLSTIYPSEVLEPLIYPLCQVIIGCIKLVPISRYYPLRLHCVRAIILLSGNTKTFVPALPFLLEILQQEDFNKKPGRMSVKPINFAVILKLSKFNLQEKAYKDGLVEQLYDLILECFHTQACSIGFPELALPTIIQLKAFLKECKVANYCKQMRQLLEKIQENCSHITGRRQKAAFGVADVTAVAAWEKLVAEEGTPLTKYYSQWKKLREKEIQLEISGKERMEDLNLPEIKRKKAEEKKADKKEFKGLFESDSDDDDDDNLFQSKEEKDDSDEDDEGLEDLTDLSDEDNEDDSDGDQKQPSSSKGKAPKKMLSTELKQVAEGDEDMVEDLELSDQD
ncbi:nucleolar complex protein 2 homolog isoform X1 [Danio rerio]|uniref:Nucleolar complex protein 2 homolog isoform X1 n=1 Tax=Danio rerio TaxID=7955 RepID=A0A8M6YXS2_DANRE|nr:nucleolar complex protein 2 homolog isoform X1 [Danio rerio]|eukprot:XP_017209089.1 nucleolar complex protein 2 homolog isoform X1 [Danio rerio]